MPKQPNIVTIEMSTSYQPWLACAKEDSQPILTGVYVDPKRFLVAADGFILAVVPAKVTGPKSFLGAILPANVLAMAYKATGKSSNRVVLTINTTTGKVTAPVRLSKNLLGTTDMNLITGTYPRWRPLIPDRKDLGPLPYIAYDPTLIGRLTKAIGALLPTINLAKNNNPGLIIGHEGAFGLVMPRYVQAPDAGALTRVFGLRDKPAPIPAASESQAPPAKIAEREAQAEGERE